MSEIKVAKVLDKTRVVVNKGRRDGLKVHDEMLIYSMGDEIIDPDSGKSLGCLEIIKGKGKVQHLQETMATVRSDEYTEKEVDDARFVLLTTPWKPTKTTQVVVPFSNPQTGDLVKVINREFEIENTPSADGD